MKIRSHLAVLLLAAALPIAGFATVLTALSWRQQRAAFEQRFLERVRAMSIALDRAHEGHIQALLALSESVHLASGDLRGFYEHARRVQEHQPGWSAVILVDATGHPLLNLRVPFGASLPAKTAFGAEAVGRIIRTGTPEISPLLEGRVLGGYTTNIGVPVQRGGVRTYVLIAAIDPPTWLAFLRSYPVASDATLTLLDQDGIVIARTLNSERWVGARPAAMFYDRSRETAEGAYRSVGLEGQRFYSAHSRARLSGWTVGTGVPVAGVEAALRRSTMAMAGGALLSLGFAVGLALFFGRRIARPIAALATSASEVTRGGTQAPLPGTSIDEIARLGRAMEEAGRAVAREKEVLIASDRAKDEFLAMLSHELRNPLAALSSAAQVLALAPGDQRMTLSARAVIERQTRHMARILEDLLDISRVTFGKTALARESFDLSEMVRGLVASWTAAGRFGKRRVDLSLADAWVDADRARIEQVLANLLDNAVKFTPDGKGIRVSVTPEESGTFVRLRVEDEGEGVSAGMLGRMFGLFVQAEQKLDRARGGLGIGLALVKRLVEMHGGSVSASSEGAGRGAAFTVRVPAGAATAARREAPAASAARPAAARRILIVEDNRDAREMLREALSLSGHDVHDAADGAAGVRLAAEKRPEVALIDIGLPDIDGYEVARRIRAADRKGVLRLVALTGYGQPADVERARQAGFDAHLTKPVSVADLERVL